MTASAFSKKALDQGPVDGEILFLKDSKGVPGDVSSMAPLPFKSLFGVPEIDESSSDEIVGKDSSFRQGGTVKLG